MVSSPDTTPTTTASDLARTSEPRADIEARAIVPAPAQQVFGFLADLERHWLVADRFVEMITLEGPPGAHTGGVVALRGPLGLRRTARTRVLTAVEPHHMAGSAEIGARTRATVRWTLVERGSHTGVQLEATVESAGLLDRILLAAGGRWWLRRRFERTLEHLAERFDERAPAS